MTTFPDSVSMPPVFSREAWLGQRTLGVGGSDVSAILGLNRWSTPRQVWLEKTGRAKENIETWAMWRGTALETPLIEWFSRRTGIDVCAVPTQQNRQHPWMLGNLDGAADDGGIVEAKTTSSWLREEWEDGQVSDHAECQAQWYMAVTGLGHAWVVAAVGDDVPTWTRVPRDDKLIATLMDACGRFWRDHVLADREPPAVAVDLPDLRKRQPTPGSVYLGDDESDRLTREYIAASDREKAARQAKADAQARLLQHLCDSATLVIDGEIAATRKTIHKDAYTVDYAARDETRLTVPRTRKPWKGSAA